MAMSGGYKRSFDNVSGNKLESDPQKHHKTDTRTRIKFLVPIYTAGAIIGAKGTGIAQFKAETQCQIHLSESQEFYPGTKERIVVVTGEAEQVVQAFGRIAEILNKEEIPAKFQNDRNNGEKRRRFMKCLVPVGVASKIVGKRGETAKALQTEHSVRLCVTPHTMAIPGLDERQVDISGNLENVISCGKVLINDHLSLSETRISSNLVYSNFPAPDGSNIPPSGANIPPPHLPNHQQYPNQLTQYPNQPTQFPTHQPYNQQPYQPARGQQLPYGSQSYGSQAGQVYGSQGSQPSWNLYTPGAGWPGQHGDWTAGAPHLVGYPTLGARR